MSNYLHKVLTPVSAFVLLALAVFFMQDLQKNYYFSQLGVLSISLKEAMRDRNSTERIYIIKNALPILNYTEFRFLKYIGYWPQIFNGYNQAAQIENLNNDKKAAVKLLLRSVHFHPNLAETYRALSTYLEQAGLVEGARKCRSYHNSLIEGSEIDSGDQGACLKWASKFCSN